MIIRLVHLTVVAALIMAAAFVYKVKFESTVRAAEVTRLAAEIKRERDAIAALRAEWAELDNPTRIQGLAERHLVLRTLDPDQLGRFDRLPERPPPPGSEPDAIGAMIDGWQPDGAGPSSPPNPGAGEGEGAAAGARGERP
jgi:cell division protein FtsL